MFNVGVLVLILDGVLMCCYGADHNHTVGGANAGHHSCGIDS